MENSDRPEKRRKYVAMKILSVAGAVLSPLLALAFLASSVFSLIANSLGEPGYFDYGVPLARAFPAPRRSSRAWRKPTR